MLNAPKQTTKSPVIILADSGLELTTHKGSKPMNNIALNAHPAQTMSSREIAELTVKEHKNVKRDCEVMFAELELDALSFEHIYSDSMNRKQTEYLLTYELVQTLITGYNIKLRHAVIQRLNQLEAKILQPIDPMTALSDPNALRGLLLTYSEKMISLESENQSMRVDVQALERISKADGSLCITDAAKSLGMGQRELHKWLSAHDWIYKRMGCAHWLGYSDKEKSGYVEHKVTEVSRPDGTTKITEQVRITPKGLAKLAKNFAAGDAA